MWSSGDPHARPEEHSFMDLEGSVVNKTPLKETGRPKHSEFSLPELLPRRRIFSSSCRGSDVASFPGGNVKKSLPL